MFIEFAGRSGVGKTSTALATQRLLARSSSGPHFVSAPEIRRSEMLAHLATNPDVIRSLVALRNASAILESEPWHNWTKRVIQASINRRLSRTASTVVVSPEVLFHWLKKLTPESQLAVASAPLPLPDLIVLLRASPADGLRRRITRQRSLRNIQQLTQAQIEAAAFSLADRLLATFDPEEAEALLLLWGIGTAEGRLERYRLSEILANAAEAHPGIDPRQHALSSSRHVLQSAKNFGLPVIEVTNSGAPEHAARQAGEAILERLRAER